MTPETLIATTKNVGLILSYQANTATVKVFRMDTTSNAWAEIPDTTNLSGASFILTGKGL